MSSEYVPKWQRELDIFKNVKSCIILEGNIFDDYIFPYDDCSELKKGSLVDLNQYLHYYFLSKGYSSIAFYDAIRGFRNPYSAKCLQEFSESAGASVSDNSIVAGFSGDNDSAPHIIDAAVLQSGREPLQRKPTAVILDFASRYISDPSNLTQDEVNSFTMLTQVALEAGEVHVEGRGNLRNIVILIVNKINDLPAWFYLDNPAVKTILIDNPQKEEREALICGDQFRTFFKPSIWQEDIVHYEGRENELKVLQDRFVGLTAGFSYLEIMGLRKLCKVEGLRIKDVCNVIDLYKFGIRDNPWNKVDLDKAQERFEKRVKGQPAALMQTLDVIKRAVTGMADITAATHGKPKGVLFFAGPTGTGKTETAKAMAETIFGVESACIRFDMSEYGQSHSDQKLLGAPPGYVGYESGGQLTNAVKKNPFSILLFDEIEKAHPSILDKFLQILEDGRMTDGKGETVYFSESIIIFTSNLGIYRDVPDGGKELVVSMDLPYEELRDTIRHEIEEYFGKKLGRPEILNRIGENIVVFDFIRKDSDIPRQILSARIEKIQEGISQNKGIVLSVSEEARRQLLTKAESNLINGGRGIGNIVESMLVNPLSRFIFDHRDELALNTETKKKIEVQRINGDRVPYSAECRIS